MLSYIRFISNHYTKISVKNYRFQICSSLLIIERFTTAKDIKYIQIKFTFTLVNKIRCSTNYFYDDCHTYNRKLRVSDIDNEIYSSKCNDEIVTELSKECGCLFCFLCLNRYYMSHNRHSLHHSCTVFLQYYFASTGLLFKREIYMYMIRSLYVKCSIAKETMHRFSN